MKFLDITKQLNNITNLVVIEGDDAYLRAKATAILKESLDIALPDINYTVFNQELNIDDVLYACETIPFCSQKKMVLVIDWTQANKLSQQAKDKLTRYATKPNPDCYLVFVQPKAGDLIKVNGVTIIDCNKLDKYTLVRWIKSKCKNNDCTIDDEACNLIVEYCLMDMTRISNETEKLIAHAQGNITTNDVNNLVHKDVEYQIFDLATYIVARDGQKALQTLDALLITEDGIALFGLLYNNFRRMYYVAITSDTVQNMATQLSVKEYAITRAKESASKYTPIQLKNALDMFAIADAKLKNFEQKETDVLYWVVLQLLEL